MTSLQTFNQCLEPRRTFPLLLQIAHHRPCTVGVSPSFCKCKQCLQAKKRAKISYLPRGACRDKKEPLGNPTTNTGDCYRTKDRKDSEQQLTGGAFELRGVTDFSFWKNKSFPRSDLHLDCSLLLFLPNLQQTTWHF